MKPSSAMAFGTEEAETGLGMPRPDFVTAAPAAIKAPKRRKSRFVIIFRVVLMQINRLRTIIDG